jgi:hypothetical protein
MVKMIKPTSDIKKSYLEILRDQLTMHKSWERVQLGRRTKSESGACEPGEPPSPVHGGRNGKTA